MVNPLFRRLALLTGSEAALALEKSRVIVFGLGGVGSWCAEALVRSGIGNISLVDSDRVSASNVNRQAQATSKNIGLEKAGELEKRLLEINPSCKIRSFPRVFSRETAELFDISTADFVIDAIDTLTHKLDLIETAISPCRILFSSMGMAQKVDPTLIRTADIWETSGCPLARLVRQGLKKRNFSGHFTAVYSPERLPNMGDLSTEDEGSGDESPEKSPGKRPLGSFVGVTAAAGLVLASLVVREICARTLSGQDPGATP